MGTMRNNYRTYFAGSLGEYMDIIHMLNNAMCQQHGESEEASGKPGQVCRMWYRGQEKDYYTLLPTLMRDNRRGTDGYYGHNHLREDLRYQHFRSKCTQLVDTSPESKIEWQEILQHHLGKTRLMDWSESAITSLKFSLEAFIDPKDDKALDHRRMSMTPSVWVLDPVLLNKHIFDSLTKASRMSKRYSQRKSPLIRTLFFYLLQRYVYLRK